MAAIGEMKRRKINSKLIEELSRSILEDLKSKKAELQRVTLKDKVDKYSLFIQLAILPAFIYFAFIFSEAFDIIPQWVSFTGIVFLVVLNIFDQQRQLRKKQKKKEAEILKIENQIEKYSKRLKYRIK